MAVRKGHILRAARIVAAVAVWVTATYTLVSYAQTLPVLAGWIARIQFFRQPWLSLCRL